MDKGQIVKQMIEFNKSTFDNAFRTMVLLQNLTVKVVSSFFEKAPLLPTEGEKAIATWANSCKKSQDDFKNAADEGYKKITDYFVNF